MIEIQNSFPTIYSENKQLLYDVGDMVDSVFYIDSGLVKTMTEDDKVVNIYKQGDLLAIAACLTSRVHQEKAVCVGKVAYRSIPKQRFLEQIKKDSDFVLDLFLKLNEQIEEYNQRVIIALQQKVEHRLMKILRFLKNKFGITSSNYINVLISPNDLASLVCTTRTTIYRTLTKLKNKGLIQVDKGLIKLVEPQV